MLPVAARHALGWPDGGRCRRPVGWLLRLMPVPATDLPGIARVVQLLLHLVWMVSGCVAVGSVHIGARKCVIAGSKARLQVRKWLHGCKPAEQR